MHSFIMERGVKNHMLNNSAQEDGETYSLTQVAQSQALEIPEAAPIRLQRLDLARHAVTAPDGRHYVVATFDDTRVGNGYITAVYPQQGGYLTLVRLVVCEYSSESRQEAVQRHLELAEAIQQGRLNEYRNKVVYHA
jgi:hypothetical protein